MYAPTELLAVGLSFVFRSSFGDRFMYQHSIKAPDEMRELHKQFYTYVKNILQKNNTAYLKNVQRLQQEVKEDSAWEKVVCGIEDLCIRRNPPAGKGNW